MGNTYTSLSTQDPQDVLLTNGQGVKSSVSMYLKKPPQKRRAVHVDTIGALAAVRSGMVLSGSRDQSVILNNMDTGEAVQQWTGHEKEVTKVVYRNVSGAHLLASGSRDESIRLWTFSSAAAVKELRGHSMSVTGLCASSDGQLFSGSRDTSIRKWDTQTGQQIRANDHTRNLVTHLAYSSASRLLAQSSEDKSVKLWDARDIVLVHEFPKKNNIQMHVDFADEGTCVLSCSNGFNGDGCEITLYDIRSPRKKLREFRGHESTVTSVCALNCPQALPRKLFMSTDTNGCVMLWNLEDGTCLWTYEGGCQHGGLHASLAFADGSIVASGADGALVQLSLQSRAGRPLLQCISYQVSEPEREPMHADRQPRQQME